MDEQSRWRRRPEGSNWGDFGADDQIGRLNLLTPERVRQAATEVRSGIVFSLSLPLDFPGERALTPHRFPPRLASIERKGRPYFNYAYREENPAWRDIVSDDCVCLSTQYSTQWDGLAHVGQLFDADADGEPEPVYYNGFRAGYDVKAPDARGTGDVPRLGIDRVAAMGLQGPGVLVDLAVRFGRSRTLVGRKELRAIMEADGVAVEEGDILCLRTGFADLVLEMDRSPDPAVLHESCAVLDGSDPELLDWISDSGVAAIAADNYAVEAVPPRPDRPTGVLLPLHEHCLFKLGIHLGELWYLRDLAAWLRQHDRNRFLLTAPPLRLPGAVGSPVTPVATV
jgi:kynurenine formamidase